jgi:hydroxyacylglutathione hydrolase
VTTMSNSALSIHLLTVGEMGTNCYIIADEGSGQALVVDPADSGDTINQYLLDHHFLPAAAILTHGHFDHCLGLLELQLAWNIPCYLHPADLFLVRQAQKSAAHWLGHRIDPIPLPQRELHEGQTFTLGRTSLEVWHTPGHTPGSVCLRADDWLMTGDTLFAEDLGKADHGYSNDEDLARSLARISTLNDDLLILPGHGESSRLGDIRLLFGS